MLDDALANLGNVEEAVEEIACPVEVGGTSRDRPAKSTQALEGTTGLIGYITDDSLR